MSTLPNSRLLNGVVPSICDAEAGLDDERLLARFDSASSDDDVPRSAAVVAESSLPIGRIRSLMNELCIAIRSALDDERSTAEDSLRRASEMLAEFGSLDTTVREPLRGGLAPWQVRKVTAYVDAHLERQIRNEDLAAIARLNPSHFGRAFRNSVGEPPHEYIIRRRVERAQGLMLSTQASLSDIALDCGLADQSHLTRLFRRIVGQSPSVWRRARINEPA